MSHLRNVATTGIVALALGAAALTAGPANADPTPAPPPYRTYAAVGSDTIQTVWDGLTNGVNGAKPAIKNVASWDAAGSTTIKTKAAGATFGRPVGSTNGAKALSAVWDSMYPSHAYDDGNGGTVALTHDEVDFSRSSSGPVSGSGLTYLPFARDAVSVAIHPFSSGNAIPNFTTAQLTAIYGGPDDNTAGTNVTYQSGSGLPVFKGHVLDPKLPQSGSGTRKFFQAAINVPDSDLGAYVDPASSVLENDGSYIPDAGDLVPFSAAQWIAQNNGVQTNTTSGDSMVTVNFKTPFTGTAPHLKAGSLFGTASNGVYTTPPTPGVGVFARDTYNVVPTSFFGGTATQTKLIGYLTGTAFGDLGNGAAKTVIKQYGFGVLSYLGDSSQYLSGAFQH